MRINPKRRGLLQAGLASGTMLLATRYPGAAEQSDATLKLLNTPKVALIIGNSDYKHVRRLHNPGNDAKAMAEALTGMGFEVIVILDRSRDEMSSAITAYTEILAKRKCIGLFYYAGHGVQLAWDNFLVPVDARISNVEDIQNACVNLTSLIDRVRKAENPMNVIILDACRENPFGKDFRVERKGLSQMDAPPGTLLAYATAPGSLASDGAGANGLYTDNLVREIKVPEARIEDVFKRVRLNVRRKTNGSQIPWESTSLEDDFYFMPPAALTVLSNEDKERQFKKELAKWDQVKDSKSPDDYYAFLQEYPNGSMSEQAQFRLDQIQKPKIEVEPGPSGVKPLASGTNRFALGDEFTYDLIDGYTKVATRFVLRVTSADNDRVEYNNGGYVTDQMGTVVRNRFGTKNPGVLFLPADIAVGKRWRTAYTNTTPGGELSTNFWDYRVVALEDIKVPAGSFRAFRVEGNGEARFPTKMHIMSATHWFDPVTMTGVRSDQNFRMAGVSCPL